LTVSFQKSGYSTYNGIAYNKGSFIEAGEFLYDYYNQENPLIAVEDFITLGFQRNKVISSHIINLEFLFNDEYAANYSINRYFGLYVNAIDLAKFNIDDKALQNFSLSLNQLPLPRKNVDGNKFSQKTFIQTNDSGIAIFTDIDSIERTSLLSEKLFTSTITDFSYDLNNIYIKLPGNCTQKIENGDIFTIKTSSGLICTAAQILTVYQNDFTEVTFDINSYACTVPINLFNTYQIESCSFYTDAKFKKFNNELFNNVYIQNSSRLFYIKDRNENFVFS
jgi:hypothetical protein